MLNCYFTWQFVFCQDYARNSMQNVHNIERKKFRKLVRARSRQDPQIEQRSPSSAANSVCCIPSQCTHSYVVRPLFRQHIRTWGGVSQCVAKCGSCSGTPDLISDKQAISSKANIQFHPRCRVLGGEILRKWTIGQLQGLGSCFVNLIADNIIITGRCTHPLTVLGRHLSRVKLFTPSVYYKV